jgi:hypothetical protein
MTIVMCAGYYTKVLWGTLCAKSFDLSFGKRLKKSNFCFNRWLKLFNYFSNFYVAFDDDTTTNDDLLILFVIL